MRGCALGTSTIIENMYADAHNPYSELGVDIRTEQIESKSLGRNVDYASITNALETFMEQYNNVVSIGGDHSITFPLIKAIRNKKGPIDLLHFDAHTDLYHEFEGNLFSHACPFARIMEAGLVQRLVQVGIRTITPEQKRQIERYNVEVIEMKDFSGIDTINFNNDVYISFDLDVLDPAFAPGVAHHEPGGMSTREAINSIQKLKGKIIAADIVEYNPSRDINGMTSIVASKILKELLGRIMSDQAVG